MTASELQQIFLPNRTPRTTTRHAIVGFWLIAGLTLWWTSSLEVLPRPNEAASAVGELWAHQNLAAELAISIMLNAKALFYTTVLSLLISYATVLPIFRPVATAISKGRFLSLTGLTFVFTLLFGGGHPLKVSLLVFGTTVFFVTSMVAEIEAIPKASYDYARTLRMSEWRVTWEVVVLGTLDKAFEVFRQVAAIGWMMLTMVEGIARSEGGIGAMLLNQNKHFRLAEVFGIQVLILILGLTQDVLIGMLKKFLLPYADLALERR